MHRSQTAARRAALVTLLAILGLVLPITTWLASPAVGGEDASSSTYEGSDMNAIQRRLQSFAPFELRFDDSRLTDGERRALEILVRAGDIIDRIFLEQMHPKNHEIFTKLRERYAAEPTAENRALLEYFWMNKCPYDLSSDEAPNERFLEGPGIAERMDPTRGFYPAGTTPEIYEAWLETLDADTRALASSDFSLIRGTVTGGASKLEAVPYSKAYAEWMGPLADMLDEAAGHVPGSTLAKFLTARAHAFRTNDYEESEGLWIGMNGLSDKGAGNIDITIGPYENYMDEMLKRKAAFQFYLTVLSPEKTDALQLYAEHVHSMDEYLWQLFQKTYGTEGVIRWTPPGDDVTLVAVDVAYASGMGNHGVQTLAFNLPNIAEWQASYGTKKVMLMNVLDGKFHAILRPITKVVLHEKDQPDVVADLFTDNTVRHEVAHGIGPSTVFVPLAEGDDKTKGLVTIDAAGNRLLARKTTVRDRMQRYYSAFEEAKAEVVSLLFGYWLAENGIVKDPNYVRRMVTTYVASTFRTIRFGATSDHAKGKVFEFNRLRDYGAIEYVDGRFRVNHDRFRIAIEKVVMDVLALQMFGDVEAAEFLLRADGHARSDVIDTLDRIAETGAPVDLRVRYSVGQNWTVAEPIR